MRVVHQIGSFRHADAVDRHDRMPVRGKVTNDPFSERYQRGEFIVVDYTRGTFRPAPCSRTDETL